MSSAHLLQLEHHVIGHRLTFSFIIEQATISCGRHALYHPSRTHRSVFCLCIDLPPPTLSRKSTKAMVVCNADDVRSFDDVHSNLDVRDAGSREQATKRFGRHIRRCPQAPPVAPSNVTLIVFFLKKRKIALDVPISLINCTRDG
jgi:hypothetical protein